MSIVTAQGLTKYYGAQEVFRGLGFSVARDDKIALVGPNGAGKTTLLRLLLGLDEPSEGGIHRARGLRVGYLPQQPTLSGEQTLYGEMLEVFGDLRARQQALLALTHEMATATDPTEAMARYAEAEQRFDLDGGYAYENRIQRVLTGLGFGPDTYDWPLAVLSGGQVTRALLARLLLQEPELLALDEPTNHLDLAALEWLESYLQSWPHSLVIVSHDRYLLDKVVSRVWELNHGELQSYRGNYSAYVAQRAANRLRQQREYEAQQAHIAETEDFIRRYGAGQRSREAKGREKRLDRLERLQAPRQDRTMALRLATELRSGDQVLICEQGATIGYPTRPDQHEEDGQNQMALFRTAPFLVEQGDRVALLGPNGSGKTTLVRTLLREIKPLEGHIRIGASVRIGYLPQTQDWLDPAKTVLEQVMDASGLLVDEARHVLGRFLFSRDDVYKQSGNLSGGELSRLGLAILTLRGANLLILDEPTTHLDVDSQEILQEVLSSFGGTILFVTHDRYLIDALATHVWSIQDGVLEQFEGNYSGYQAEKARWANEGEVKISDGGDWEERRRELRQRQLAQRRRDEQLESLEREIARLEAEIEHTTQSLHRASASQDAARIPRLGRDYEALQQALSESLHEWERLASPTEQG
jgi:ATP-binding cassette subfamily F protein 3